MANIFNRVKSLVNPWKAIDTLDSPSQATGPPLKKQKTGSEDGRSVTAANEYSKSHFALFPESIEDAGSDHAARTDRTGSHGSLTGVIEFQNVQGLGLRDGKPRSDRRRRSRAGSQSPRSAQRYGRSIEPGRDDIDNSDRDELAEKSPYVSSGHILRRVNSATNIVDAADAAILGSPRKRSIELLRPVKRPLHHVDGEEDELALESPTNPRALRRAASSSTTKGSTQATKRNNSHDPVPKEQFLQRLYSALCLPNHRYIQKGPQGWCFLGEFTNDAKQSQLCACSGEGDLLPELDWLKITKSVNTIHHNAESSYVKIRQSKIGNVGGQMVLQFFNTKEAQEFVQWVKENLSANVVEMNSATLQKTYENLMTELKKATSGSPSPLANSRVTRTTSALDVEGSRNMAFEPAGLIAQATAGSPTASTRRRPRLVDTLLSSQQALSNQYEHRSFEVEAPVQRSSRRRNDDTVMVDAPPISSAPVSRWTEDHSEWSKNWRMPLVYHRTSVDKDDIPRLDEGQCLNDNLLGFGLRYLFEEYPGRHDELKKRVYVHNTFFYEKLKPAKSKDINYDGVKGWTSKVDLLSYDYIIVPVNEYYHWWVAIICNPGKLDPNHPRRSTNSSTSGTETSDSNSTESKSNGNIEKSDDVEMIDIDCEQARDQGQEIKAQEACGSVDRIETDSNEADSAGQDVVDLVADDTDHDLRERLKGITKLPKKDPSEETKILTLDSMGNSHYPAVQALKKYLMAEFEDKKQTKIKDLPKQIGIKATNIPEQNNFSDCGVYLLGYIQEFVKDPDRFAHCLMQREKPGWEFNPSELREYWRNTIFEKQKEHQAKHDEEKKRKKEEAARRKAASSTPSDAVMSATESQTSGRTGLSHDPATDNVSSAPQFVRPPVVSRNTNPNIPAPAPKPTTALRSPLSYGASSATGTVTNTAAVAAERGGGSKRNMPDPLEPIPRPPTRPQQAADNVVVDLERDESEPKDKVSHLSPDSPLPGEIRRSKNKDYEHSPKQHASSRTPRQSPEVKFIPKLPDSSPASDRRTSGIAQEISPQTFYSNAPQRPESPKLLSLKSQSPRPQSPLVERKRRSSPARKAKASPPARKTAPSPELVAQPLESIEIFDPPTPEAQRPSTTSSKVKAEQKDNNHVNHGNKTTYKKSDKHTRQKSRIPRRVVDDTDRSGIGSGKSRRVEQQQQHHQRQPRPSKPKETAETKSEEIPDSPPPAMVVSDIPAVQSAEMTPIDLTDEN
ncbi:hypothetical protein GE21DRAFT_7797 [Neurospora crassa]|nr:uncharacterized protein NCU01366 [Neurospora crassa OR74A]XP_011394517.1 uncharacterized protein NCU01366 [Neurospora crassa OR74A]KHE80815.1 hypothetical protein GE21DRAFT_7797 [Neurospora crassa]ESA42562.1 hypothetical protein, variant 1 [Neurospora crassa OR74A]ESA42563.1 hypothetical protein, variant 2 [Neurospora crassa OR74A]CAB88639.1 related to protease ULP2 protein [Neurospora crassa]|eukprot:XP_011394515.1 uncharacterized protein NCU01366 [Neurospora crassa OR74A]